MYKKLIQDLLVLHVVGICILLLGNAIGSRYISVYLVAEVVWLLLFGYLIVKSKEKWLLVLITLPISFVIEAKLILVVAMSLPYMLESVFAN